MAYDYDISENQGLCIYFKMSTTVYSINQNIIENNFNNMVVLEKELLELLENLCLAKAMT